MTSEIHLPKAALPSEEIRLVPGFEAYCVSNYGRIWSRLDKPKANTVNKLQNSWHALKPYVTKRGHKSITLHSASRQIIYMMHRLVLEVFVGPCPIGLECCHNDGNPANNYVGNLRWDTTKANMADRDRQERLIVPDNRGERCAMAILTETQVREIRWKRGVGLTEPQLAERYGVSRGTIASLLQGRSWKHVK